MQLNRRGLNGAEKETCHTAGQLSMTDMLRLAMAGVFRDGEFFIRKIHRAFGRGEIPFALEVIEPDLLLDFEGAPVRSNNGAELRLGIEVDDWSDQWSIGSETSTGRPDFSADGEKSQKNTGQRNRAPVCR